MFFTTDFSTSEFQPILVRSPRSVGRKNTRFECVGYQHYEALWDEYFIAETESSEVIFFQADKSSEKAPEDMGE